MIHVDFETRSTIDLKEVGLYNYARHATTSPWCMAVAVDDGPVHVLTEEDFAEEAKAIADLLRVTDEVWAHNAPFELAIWNSIMVPRYGWPVLDYRRTHCTMAAAYAMGLPGALEDAAMALGLAVQKDGEGRKLMLKMARPRSKPGVTPVVWWDAPELRGRLQSYCRQDVIVERAMHARLMPLGKTERAVWLLDYEINQRGFAVDLPSAAAGVKLADHVKQRADTKLTELTGGAVQSHTALIPLKAWIGARLGAPVDSLAKETVTAMLTQPLPDDVRAALLLRQEAGLASTSKLEAMLALAGADGRIHNAFQYHGAGTGRWAGRGLQPHNFIRDVPPAEEVDAILKHFRDGNYGMVELFHGMPMTMLSRCLRGFIMPAPGKVLVGGDYSSIEGRGTSWVAGEEWKLQAFRDADAGTGPGIYELSYARAFNVAVESVKNPSRERQVGKVQELAFGYQGGAGAWMTMAGAYNLQTTVEEGERNKVLWRAAHPRTVKAWYALERAAKTAVATPGVVVTAEVAQPIKFLMAGSFLWCQLPSGRTLCYPYPKMLAGDGRDQLTYMTVPNPAKPEKIIADPQNGPRWGRVSTYGGKLLENVVQALCRDILAYAMLRLDAAGFSIVLHVHDDVQAEEATDRSAEMTRIMTAGEPWSTGFPIATKCHAAKRYGK